MVKPADILRRVCVLLLCLCLFVCDLPFCGGLTVHAATEEELEQSWDLYHLVLSTNPDFFLDSYSYTDEERQMLLNIALDITKGCKTNREKIYSIVEYVARNVYYDWDYYQGRTNTTNTCAIDVLKNGYAVCDGYARTVDELLDLLKIPCIYVLSPDHAWNMAFDGERWILADATWVSGNTKDYNVFYKSDFFRVEWLDFPAEQAMSNFNHTFERVDIQLYNGELYQHAREIPEGADIILPSTVQTIYWIGFMDLNTIYLPRSVKTIYDDAFGGVTADKVLYEGSAKEFAAIDIGEYNENLLSADITFLDCASVPSITRHPLDQLAGIGTEVTLTAATAPVEGTVSYQWYRNTSRSNKGGTAIPGANQATYTFIPEEEGTDYYYVVATNRNSAVSGKTASSDTSVAVKVQVFDREPSGHGVLGPNACYYQFSEPDEIRLEGCDPILDDVFSSLAINGTVFIPAGITDIDAHVDDLRDCDGFVVDPDNPVYRGDDDGALIHKSSDTLVCLPMYVDPSVVYSYSIPDGITAIADDAFAAYYMSNLHIPAHVTDIQGALGELYKLEKITVEDGHSRFSIHNSALIDDVGNRLIKYPVRGDTGTYTVPDGIRTIESKAFYETYIDGIALPEGLQVIGDMAFDFCDNLSGTLTLPDSLIYIGKYAFQSCDRLSGELVLPEKLAEIGYGAFNGCKGLSGALVIPDSVTSLGEYCFSNCKNIETVTLPAGLEILPANAFYNCSALTQITLPHGLLEMNSGCLSGAGLTEITIPSTVTSIAENAFSDHESITVYGCAGSYAQIYAQEHNMTFVDIGVSASSVSPRSSSVEMIVGTTWKPEFSLRPAGTTDAVSLTSSAPEIVAVQSGCKLTALKAGKATIKAVTTGGSSCTFTVTVSDAASLQVAQLPTRTGYECGEALDLSGLKIEAVLSGGRTVPVTDYSVSGFESRNPGKKNLTVTCGNLSVEFPVYVGETQRGNWTDSCTWSCGPSGALTVSGTLPAAAKLIAATYLDNGTLVEVSMLQCDQSWQPTKSAAYAKLFLLQPDYTPYEECIQITLPAK